MLIDLADLKSKYSMNISGILHVGAHLGEEADLYDRLDVPHVWWVEGNPDVMPKLESNISRFQNQEVIQALITDTDDDTIRFNITNYDGMSSSIFPFGTHIIDSPDTIYIKHFTLQSRTIDSLADLYHIKANFLNLDMQGSELLALKGATKFLEGIDFIYSEVSTGPVYIGGALMHEIDEYLTDFSRVETDLGMHRGKHGDALYARWRTR